jgi:YebC/PmpR family DNA-binding regulatory protein
MSGHSKWATIKRQKGAADVKRGQAFTKLSMAITLAVKQGGGIGDPDSNFRLRLAIDAAKAANMPKDNIARAIDRASGKNMAHVDEVVYEGFGPHGIAVIVEGATDNKMRTTSEVKNLFDRQGGSMGQPGSVSYLFKQVGRIEVVKKDKSLDDIFLLAVDSGAEDVEESGEVVNVFTKPSDLARVRQLLTQQGIEITEEELEYVPLTKIAMENSESTDQVIAFLEKMEDLQDVQKVYSNIDVDN